MVHDVAGTTVDPVDSLIEMDGKIWRFVDTAGLRRKVGQASGHEFYASVRTHGAIDAAEVAIVLIDASQPLTEQDQRVLSMVIEAGRALVLAFNKWDLVDEDRRYLLEREIERELAQLQWAPRVNISAKTGRAVQKAGAGAGDGAGVVGQPDIDRPAEHVLQGGGGRPRRRRCAAGSSRGSCSPRRRPRGRRRSCCSPAGFLEAGYRRFLERRLRETFGFEGSPIRINVRVREKRGAKSPLSDLPRRQRIQ